MKKITVIFLILLCFIGNAKTIYPQGKALWLASLFSEPPASPSYKVYTALLSQTGTGAPTVIILENTLGTIVWSRLAVGTYIGTLVGAFPTNKVFISPIVQKLSTGDLKSVTVTTMSNDALLCATVNTAGAGADNIAVNCPIEIRVYP